MHEDVCATSDCCINNALIHFVTSCQDTCTQFVNVLDPLLVAPGFMSYRVDKEKNNA